MTSTDATSICVIIYPRLQKRDKYQASADPQRISFPYEPSIVPESSSTQAKIKVMVSIFIPQLDRSRGVKEAQFIEETHKNSKIPIQRANSKSDNKMADNEIFSSLNSLCAEIRKGTKCMNGYLWGALRPEQIQ
ncbi:predicted protein [Botrytis cinerea T4]|uniref:Uncharacterized protein n=1 Tax=Botryotinia fuckeliana (strain T4) TaxID=999810 RepID=G2YN67_BOTF4|nr:predicted protein [Botrytis cinerea T4]